MNFNNKEWMKKELEKYIEVNYLLQQENESLKKENEQLKDYVRMASQEPIQY